MSFEIGIRVVTANNGKGRVSFCGTTQFAEGEWIGVVLDEPRGKNNGSVNGVEYFTCEPSYGLFVRATQLTVEGAKKTSGLRAPAPNAARKDHVSAASSRAGSTKPSPGSSPGMSPAVSTERLTKSQTTARKVGSTSRLAESVPNESRLVRESSNLSQASVASSRTGIAQPRASIAPDPKKKLSSVAAPSTAKAPAKPTNTQTTPSSARVAPPTSLPSDELPPPVFPQPEADQATPTAESVLSRAKRIDDNKLQVGSATPMSPISTSSKASADTAAEMEYLRLQVKELTDKLDNLRAKRKEDHAKLLEYDRQKIEMISLMEVKSKLSEKVVEQEKQILDERKISEDLRAWKDEHQEMLNEHQEAIEMASIDKEMAEMKVETLQAEVNHLQEKCDELQKNLEIVQEEATGASVGGEGAVANSVQVKQLTQQNERLALALMKLRDINGQATVDKQQAEKEAEKLRTENAELIRIAEALKRQTEIAESKIAGYQEQIDAAMGAEEMVTQLSTKNLDLEEQIQKLEGEIEDMEALRDMDEQIAETQKQVEKDLLKDIETLQIKISEMNGRIRDEQKHSEELSKTILKFRTRTAQLNEDIQEHKDQILRLEEELHGHRSEENSMASMVSQLQVNANRAFAETVDRQVNAIELEFSKRHAGYLKAFLPDNFAKAGGDNDSVLMCVLFPRLAAKAKLFAKLVHERYPTVPGGMRREHVTRSHKAEQWAHSARVAYLTNGLIAVLGQFESAVAETSLERLSRLTASQTDMAQHEKTMDQYIDLLRQGRFDENTSLDNIDKAVLYFQNVFSLHMGSDAFNAAHWTSAVCTILTSGIAYCKLNLTRIRHFLQTTIESGEVVDLLNTINDELSACEGVASKANKNLPTDATKMLKINPEFTDEILNACAQLDRIAGVLRETCAIGSVNMNAESEGFDSNRLREMIHGVVEKVNGSIALDKTFEPIRKYLYSLRSSLEKTTDSLDGGRMEYPVSEKKPFPPLLDRAHQRKQAASEAEGLRWQMEKKDNEMLELRKQMKARIEDIGNYKLRLDMAEARMNSADKQDSSKVEQMEQKITQLVNDHKKKENEYEETLDALQREMKEMNVENNELKQRANNISKHALWKGIQSMEARSGAPSPASTPAGVVVGGASRAEVNFLESRLNDTRSSLKRAELEIIRLKTEAAQIGFKRISDVPGLISGPLTLEAQSHAESRSNLLNELHKEALLLKKDEAKYWIYVPNASLPENRQRDEREKWQKSREAYYDKLYSLQKRLVRGWSELHPGEAYPFHTNNKPVAVSKAEEDKKFEQTCAKWGIAW